MTTLSSRPCLVSAITLNDSATSVWLVRSSVTFTAPAASAVASAWPSACRTPATGMVQAFRAERAEQLHVRDVVVDDDADRAGCFGVRRPWSANGHVPRLTRAILPVATTPDQSVGDAAEGIGGGDQVSGHAADGRVRGELHLVHLVRGGARRVLRQGGRVDDLAVERERVSFRPVAGLAEGALDVAGALLVAGRQGSAVAVVLVGDALQGCQVTLDSPGGDLLSELLRGSPAIVRRCRGRERPRCDDGDR